MGNRYDFWSWRGTIERGPYLILGLSLFLIKFLIDQAVAATIFKQQWNITRYLLTGRSGNIAGVGAAGGDGAFYATFVALSLPFVLAGIGLTLRRLRSVRWPLWLVMLFFIPIVNLIFFAALSLTPGASDDDVEEPPGNGGETLLDVILPSSALGSALAGLAVTVLLGVAGTALSVHALGDYGWGIFVGLPFCLGLTPVLIYGYHEQRTLTSCLMVSLLAALLSGAALLLFAFEGLICLLMAVPLAVPLTLLGGAVGYVLHLSRHRRIQMSRVLSGVLIGLPGSMGVEHADAAKAPQIEATTSIEIDAPPEQVWQKVVAFQQIPEPQEWIFRLGVAYPLKAEIEGRGPGAIRHCVFSTGAFVEPIHVWDEPRLLKFSVTQNPEPMHELTFYTNVHPPHLHGFLVSDGGQFLLTRLPGGRTRVDGTTWYHHGMWPAAYWQLWSDRIIHLIHTRVLRHIKAQVEAAKEN